MWVTYSHDIEFSVEEWVFRFRLLESAIICNLKVSESFIFDMLSQFLFEHRLRDNLLDFTWAVPFLDTSKKEAAFIGGISWVDPASERVAVDPQIKF